MTPVPEYWKVKAAVLEMQLAEARAQLAVERARAKSTRTLLRAGIDPDANYEFLDADESVAVL